MERVYTVCGTGEGRLVRDILRYELGLSQTAIRRVKHGGLLVGDTAVTVRHLLRAGETLTVTLADRAGSDIPPLPLPLDVLYEDERLLAVCKPVGMPVHPSRGNHLPTLAEGVMHYMGPDFVFRAVNRLDRDTSGIVLIAKDAEAAYHLSLALRGADGSVEKTYLAITEGIPQPMHGRIEAPIARESEGAMRRTVRPDGRSAVTDYEVCRCGVTATGTPCALVCVRPLTGRTHQIRVHMAHVGTPLLYDFLYGQRREGTAYFLHCQSLSFPHPADGRRIGLRAERPLPGDGDGLLWQTENLK